MKSIIRLFSKVDGKSKDIESIVDGSLSLDKAICTEYELQFGGCIASKFTTNIYEPVTEDYDRIQYIQLDNDVEAIIFEGIIDSLNTDDGVTTKITAYDDLSKEDNVASWYISLFTDNTSILLSNLLKSLLTHLGIKYNNNITLKNDFSVTQTIMSNTIDCRDMLKWICELQGGFGYIEAGVFNIGYLQTSNPVELNVLSGFTKSKIISNKIDKVQLKSEEDDIGAIYGTGSNALIIQGNPLLYGKTVEELNSIAKKLFDNVKDITYIPYEAELPIGNPRIDLFKKYTIKSSNDTINSYILSTSLSGSRLVNQTIFAKGTETRTTIVNDVNTELFVLDYKTNKIKKDIDGLNIEVQEINNKSGVLTEKVTDLTVDVDGISTKVETLQTDLSNATDNIIEVKTIAEQTADKFNWLVESGTSATNFTLTDRTATLIANDINLNGRVTFSGLNLDTQNKINTANAKAQGIIDNIYTKNTTTIDGSKITTGSITSNKLFVNDLTSLSANIAGFQIKGGNPIYPLLATIKSGSFIQNADGSWTLKGSIGFPQVPYIGDTVVFTFLYQALEDIVNLEITISGSYNGVNLNDKVISLQLLSPTGGDYSVLKKDCEVLQLTDSSGALKTPSLVTITITSDKLLNIEEMHVSGLVSDGRITYNTDSFATDDDSLYISNNGISLGKTFSVTNKGYLEASSGKIAGFEIIGNSLRGGYPLTDGHNYTFDLNPQNLRYVGDDILCIEDKYYDSGEERYSIGGFRVYAVDALGSLMVEARNLKCTNTFETMMVYSDSDVMSSGDVYANYGTSNQVSLQTLNSNLTNLLGLGFIKLLNGGVIKCANWGNTNANTLRITLSNLNLLLNDAVKFLVITRYGFYFYNVTIGGSGTLGCSTLGYMPSTTGVYGITKISDSVVDITLGSWTGVTVFSFCPSNGAFNWSATRINK